MARLRVVQAGPLVSVQDGGRFGMLRYGVPGSGPMDRGAFAIANAALGNPAGAAGIEVSLGGLELECVVGAVSFAVAGGGFRVGLEGVEIGSWAVAHLRAGERLRLRPGLWGSWTYLCFAGELQVHHWLGSAATHGLSGFGGGKLTLGAEVEVAEARVVPEREGALVCPVFARPRRFLRVVPGPQERFFAPATLQAFLSRPFSLTDSYDRMGVRLAGPPLVPSARLDMPSEPIVRGSVQVAGDGVATVLLADHQTTGGYPKIATVLSCDLDGFVQARSRDAVAFRAVSPEAAVAARRLADRGLARYLEGLRRRSG